MAKLEKPKHSEMCPPGYHVESSFNPNAKSALIGYHQWNKKGETYADEVLSRYEKARKKK